MRSPLAAWLARHPVRVALLVSLALLWLNFGLTTRWAGVDGSINGAKRPFFALALLAATVLSCWRIGAGPADGPSRRHARLVAIGGIAVLACAFISWFPIRTWRLVPFLDDWPIRFHAALDMMRLIDNGSFAGWEWRFLGGYHSSSDATQGLGTLTYLPMKLLGPLFGFHLAHAVLFAAVPAVVWLDLSQDPRRDERVTTIAVGFAALLAAGYGFYLIRSGDTNSVGGVVMAMVAVAGAHAARRGARWGSWVLVGGLALTVYAHPGFFAYASLFLLLDAAMARDLRSAIRAAVAIGCALVASLPLTFETWRYPELFHFNNVVYTSPPFDLMAVARSFYYNVELTWLPNRWFNDYSGLAMVFLPVTAALAIVDRSRVRFYAAAALLTIALKWFVNIHTGYVFLRPVHLLPIWMSPVLAALVVRHVGSRPLRWSLVAVVAIYVPVWLGTVPHLPDIRTFDAELTRRIEQAPGALVLLENNPHRNMNADPGGSTEPSRFGIHFEPMIAETTGRRLYSGGYSDGWQWNPWRGNVVGGGTFRGRSIAATPHDAFVDEMRRWGVVDLFVWSDTTNAYLRDDARFVPQWAAGAWTQYRLGDPDPREVVAETGRATLESRTPFGAAVTLSASRSGTPVIVRTNFHPAWRARSRNHDVALVNRDGQLSFDSPCDGDCVVTLQYPKRHWLLPVAIVAILAGGFGLRRFPSRPS